MRLFLSFTHFLALLLLSSIARGEPVAKADGYHGIWYFNQPTKDEYRYQYSGGFATYPKPLGLNARSNISQNRR